MITEPWLLVWVWSSGGFFTLEAASSSFALKSGESVLDGDDMVNGVYVSSLIGNISRYDMICNIFLGA